MFGFSAALCDDGYTVLLGAAWADVGVKSDQGVAYVFAVGTLKFAAYAYSVSEDSGMVTVAVTRVNDSSGVASVNYATADGTTDGTGDGAVAGTDYMLASGALAWPDGNADNKSFRVPIINRPGEQRKRSFMVQLSNAAGASLGEPCVALVTIQDPRVGPTIKANGTENHLAVQYPMAVSVSVSLNAGNHTGTAVDWWAVALAHPGEWYCLNNAMQWVPFSGDWALCQPGYQGALFNLSATPLLNNYLLPPGIYDFWFGVDCPMDGILDLHGQIAYDQVTVVVQ